MAEKKVEERGAASCHGGRLRAGNAVNKQQSPQTAQIRKGLPLLLLHATDALVPEHDFRGNSGVFLLGLYEIQVLDGYDNRTYADGQTGAIYGQ